MSIDICLYRNVSLFYNNNELNHYTLKRKKSKEIFVMSEERDAGVAWSGERIKNLRKSLNVSQAWLADILDVTIRTVSRWETGKVYPTSKIIRRLEALAKKKQTGTSLPLSSGQTTLSELIRSITQNFKALQQLVK